MDKLATLIKEHRQEMMDALNKIDNGSEEEKVYSMGLLNNLLLGVSSLEAQAEEGGSDAAKEEMQQLLKVAKRAKVVRKREKDKEYQKKAIKQVKINLNYRTDADIIEILDSKDNVQGYIKDVIRRDTDNNTGGQDIE